jgi:hypothetical protein
MFPLIKGVKYHYFIPRDFAISTCTTAVMKVKQPKWLLQVLITET